MTCEVCGKDGAEDVFRQYAMHRSCAPAHWVKDQDDLDEFMRRVNTWWQAAPAWKREWDGSRSLRAVS